jgi:hypothetical protein
LLAGAGGIRRSLPRLPLQKENERNRGQVHQDKIRKDLVHGIDRILPGSDRVRNIVPGILQQLHQAQSDKSIVLDYKN